MKAIKLSNKKIESMKKILVLSLQKSAWIMTLLLSSTEILVAESYQIRTDGTVVNSQGDSFFGYGFYSDSDTLSEIKADMSVIGQAGFNMMFVEPHDNNEILALLDEAEKYPNLRLIWSSIKGAGGENLPQIYSIIPTIRQKKSLFAYGIGDDIHSGTPLAGWPATLDDVLMMQNEFKSRDPDHVTFVALGNGSNNVFDVQRFDIGGQEIYPINGGSKISLVYETTLSCVNQAAQYPLSPWTIMQTFNLGENSSQRNPNAKEYYNMLYQGIVAGAKGLIGYSFSVGGSLNTRSPDVWKINADESRGRAFCINVGIRK
jgi:hypothetical protein